MAFFFSQPGDVDSVIAGSGLFGGGTMGDISLNVDFSQTQARINTSCATGGAISAVAQDGSVTCESIEASSDPIAGVLNVSPAEFEDTQGHQNTQLNEWRMDSRGYLMLDSAGGSPPINGSFRAPLHLPVGVTVTKLEDLYYDNDTIANLVARLFIMKREPLVENPSFLEPAIVPNASGTDPTIHRVSTTSISEPTIEADVYYWLNLFISIADANNGPDARFYGARIEYMMP